MRGPHTKGATDEVGVGLGHGYHGAGGGGPPSEVRRGLAMNIVAVGRESERDALLRRQFNGSLRRLRREVRVQQLWAKFFDDGGKAFWLVASNMLQTRASDDVVPQTAPGRLQAKNPQFNSTPAQFSQLRRNEGFGDFGKDLQHVSDATRGHTLSKGLTGLIEKRSYMAVKPRAF